MNTSDRWRVDAARALKVACAAIALGCGFAHATDADARITGTAAGPECGLLAIGVTRKTQSYPVLGGLSGWSRGIPTVSSNVAELWVFRRREGQLALAQSMEVPSRWKGASDYSIATRVLPDESVIFTLRGCAKGHEGCDESESYVLGPGKSKAKRMEGNTQPEVTPAESAHIKRCTTYLTYETGDKPNVSIGPNGGPWTPVLSFNAQQLAILPAK